MSNNLSTITTDFINREGLGFLARIVNEGNTIELATLQTGVRHKATVNSVFADGNFQYGNCAGTADQATTSSFNAREILACKTTLFDGICMSDVQDKFGNLGGEGAIVQNADVLRPLAEGALSTFQSQIEKNLWNRPRTSLCGEITGLYSVISGSTTGVTFSGSASPNAWVGDAVATPTSNNIIAQVNAVYQNIPELASNKGDLAIFMSVALFKMYVNALSTSTGTVLGGYNVKQTANRSLMYIEHPTAPGVIVVGTMGLTGGNRIVGGPAKDIVVGTDLAAEATNFQLWYDINADQLKYRISAKFGAQIANPTFWVSNDLA